jgi:5-methylcytosine-specific restriction endonuclease McrA
VTLDPVIYSADQCRQIKNELQSPSFSDHIWGEERLNLIRAAIKEHYVHKQDYRCCYCRQQIFSDHGRAWDIEHVISRSEMPRFMFVPRNLAVACIECNVEKKARKVTDKSRSRFPAQSQHYIIVHPHFDEYEDHIEIRGDGIYIALSRKGGNTIWTCNLFRFYQKKAQIYQPIKDQRFERDIGELRLQKTLEDAEPIVASIMKRLEIEERKHISEK